jgi:hypothetical protein
MTALGIFQSRPDHVLLRRYEHGVGVEPHIDSAAYGPVVAGLTLGSSRAFQLTRRLKGSSLEAILFPGDLYVMSGPARYRWRHSIPARLEDTFRGVSFQRTGGFSVTWRFLPRRSGRDSGTSRFQTTAKPLPHRLNERCVPQTQRDCRSRSIQGRRDEEKEENHTTGLPIFSLSKRHNT